MNLRLAAAALLFLIASHFAAFAQTAPSQPVYHWRGGDLTFAVPDGWQVSAPARTDAGELIALMSDGATIRLLLLSDETEDALIRAGLNAEMTELALLPIDYAQFNWFGLSAQRANARGSDGLSFGAAQAGRLPNRHVLIATLRAPNTLRSSAEAAYRVVLESLALSADSPITLPEYVEIWRFPAADEPALEMVRGVEFAGDSVLVVDSERGVLSLNAETGALQTEQPFDVPANPTGIAAVDDGLIYIGDTVCRCLRTLQGNTWGPTVAAFGGNAPFNLTDDGTTLYAADLADGAYALQTVRGGRADLTPLSFNGAAAPYVAASAEGVIVIEWLASLVDPQVHGAVSLIRADAPELIQWLDVTPDDVLDIALTPEGSLALSLSDGRIAVVQEEALIDFFRTETPSRAFTFGADGELISAGTDGIIRAYAIVEPPRRVGSRELLPNVPVVGMVDEAQPSQTWTYSGRAGETATISAVDPTRTNGLDMAVRVIAPDGRELAYNDDQRGPDLWGRFDAQIRDLVFPSDGQYTIIVDRVQGAGSYVLGVIPDREIILSPDEAITVTGRLMDVFPVERWVFEGRAGQNITLTMFAESGNLDPALEVLRPSGGTLAYNDDAYDPQLGTNAQLFRLLLPEDGTYVIEASRFDGTGRYTIIGVVNP
jgi:hypothetical protein